MAKAQKILLLVSKILGLATAGLFLLLALILGIGAFIASPNGTGIAAGIAIIIGYGFVALICAFPALIAFLFGNSMIALDENAKRNAIISIIAGAIGGDVPLIIAAIFTMVLLGQKARG